MAEPIQDDYTECYEAARRYEIPEGKGNTIIPMLIETIRKQKAELEPHRHYTDCAVHIGNACDMNCRADKPSGNEAKMPDRESIGFIRGVRRLQEALFTKCKEFGVGYVGRSVIEHEADALIKGTAGVKEELHEREDV